MSYEIGVLGSKRKETVFIGQAQGFPVKADTPSRSESNGIYAASLEVENGASGRKESIQFVPAFLAITEHPKMTESRWPNYFSMFDHLKRGESISPFPITESPKRSERKVSGTQDSQDTPKRSEAMTYTNA